VLDFDHRDPSQKVAAVSDMTASGYDVPTIETEIAKCDVLCSNCHRKRTAFVGGYWRACISSVPGLTMRWHRGSS
jgi:hypothetical protein